MTASQLLNPLREHLLSSSSLTDLVGDRVHASRAPEGLSSPYVLYRIRNARHEYGFGGPGAGQTTNVLFDVHIVEEAGSSASALVSISAELHVLMVAWSAPSGWAIRDIELESERSDAFGEQGRFYETHTMSYRVVLEAT